MSLISLIPLNGKNIMLIIYIVVIYLCYLLPNYYDGIVPLDFDLFDSITQILITVPYFIRKIKLKKKIFKKSLSEYPKIDYIIFFLVIILNFLDMTLYVIYDDSLFYISELFNWSNLEIFFLMILSKFSLNTSFHIHHIIGLAIMLTFSFINDYYLIKNNNDDISYNFKHCILSILDCVLEAIVLGYKKYLIDIKFISVYVVCFFFGLINLIYILILYLIQYYQPRIFCLENNCLNIFKYENDFKHKITLVIVIGVSLMFNMIFFFLYYKTIYYFTPAHTLLVFYLSSIITIFEITNDKHSPEYEWVIIIFSLLFTLFGLFIYLEIIELNFWDLNKNTRRNIEQRLSNGSISSEMLLITEFPEQNENEKKTSIKSDDTSEDRKSEDKTNYLEIKPGYLVKI